MASPSSPRDDLAELKEFVARLKIQASGSYLKGAKGEHSHEQQSDSSHGALETKAQLNRSPHSQGKPPHPGYERPSRDVGSSTLNPMTPSPAQRGVMAPQNTPLVTATDPDTVLAAEKEAAPSSHEVGDAIADYLKGMDGKPLAESMWAPKSVTQRRPLAKGPRKENCSPNLSKSVASTWEGLLPVKGVEPKSSSPKTFTHMPHQKTLPNGSRQATPNSPAIKSAQMESEDVVPVALTKETRQETLHATSTKDRDTTSDRLVPVKLVEPKPDINETFTRMSFKAAEPKSQPCMVDAFTQTETTHPKSEVMDFAPLANPHDVKDEKSQPVIPRHKTFSLPVSDAAQQVNRHVRTNPPSTPPPAPAAGSGASTTPTQTLTALKTTGVPKGAMHGDFKHEQPDLAFESLKRWACEQKALLAKVSQSNGGGNSESGQSAPAASSSSAIAKPAEGNEDRRFMQYFSTWGPQEKRDRPRKLPLPLPLSIQLRAIQQTDPFQAAEVRTAIIKALPATASLAFVANLVYGGPLEKIRIHVSGKGASVTFLNPADCKKFFDDTANGLAYNTSPSTGPVRRFRHLEVELSSVVEPVVGKLYEYVQKGLTRCVKAVPVEDGLTMSYLQKMAADKNRSVVKVQEGRGIANVRMSPCRRIAMRACLGSNLLSLDETGPLHHLSLWQH